jgi:hypothetical protein
MKEIHLKMQFKDNSWNVLIFIHADQAIPGHKTILVIVEGLVKFDGHKAENFSQNFLLTVEGAVWKVASDCFRFIEWVVRCK